MADKLDDFKKTFEGIKKRSDAASDELDKTQRLMGQTTGIIQEGCKEIGLRIQELKDAGAQGSAIEDFLGDKEVKSMYDSVLSHLKTIETDIKRMDGLHAGEFKKLKKDFSDLKQEMATEIATRKKAASTKLGVGNKSLPDMEKLLKTAKDYTDQKPFALIDVYMPESIADHKKQIEGDLKREIAKTKEAKLTAFQQMMQEQALNTRVLVGNFNKAKGFYTSVLTECKTAQEALEKRDNKALMTAKASVVGPMKQLGEMADMYKKALADQWISSNLKKSKDKDKIETAVKGVLSMYAAAGTELKKVANARIE